LKTHKRGFTLIELIVVFAIMGIIAAIAVPNFTGLMHKIEVEEIVRQAQIMDDELSALTGLQYAEIGRAPRYGHSASDRWGTSSLSVVPENNYIVAILPNNNGYNYFGISEVGYVTIANNVVPQSAAAINPNRKSAGLTEFYRQTGLDLATMERGPGSPTVNSNYDAERRWYALQFYPLAYLGESTVVDGQNQYGYIHPEESRGGLFYVKYNGTWYMVIHNGKLSGTSTWVGPNQIAADPGHWNVYRNTDYNDFAYENTGGRPFGTIND
jgi:prepilin-type N-terminal cleavage/methylation domain-containing protein